MTNPSAALLRAPTAVPAPASSGPRSARAPAPGRWMCLRCQLLGRRGVTCALAGACRELPRLHPLGPLLVAGWLATAVAFVIAVW